MARQQVINSVDSDCIYPTVRLHLANMSKTSGLMLWRTWPHNEICVWIEYLSAQICPRRCYLCNTQSWNERFAIISVLELTSFLCIVIISDTRAGSSTLSTQVENKVFRFVLYGEKFPRGRVSWVSRKTTEVAAIHKLFILKLVIRVCLNTIFPFSSSNYASEVHTKLQFQGILTLWTTFRA